MATARKNFAPAKPTKLEPNLYAAFVADLLSGVVKAVALIDTRPGGKLDLKYDDPNG